MTSFNDKLMTKSIKDASAYKIINYFKTYLNNLSLWCQENLDENQKDLAIHDPEFPIDCDCLPVSIIEESISWSDTNDIQFFSVMEHQNHGKCWNTDSYKY